MNHDYQYQAKQFLGLVIEHLRTPYLNNQDLNQLTEEELQDWGEKNAENRKIVFTT